MTALRITRLGSSLAISLATCALSGLSLNAQVLDPEFPAACGTVYASCRSGDTLYVGGNFTWLGPANGSCVAIDAATGVAVADWPRVSSRVAGQMFPRTATCAVPDGAGGCYVGGTFDDIGGLSRAHLAHIRGDGTVDAWQPDGSGWTVASMAWRDSTVYVGGSSGGAMLAAIDARSGVVLWRATGTGSTVAAIAVGDRTVYAGGAFDSLGGGHRNLVQLDPETGRATAWDPGVDDYVRALAMDDSLLFVGGWFRHAGGATRPGLAAFGRTSLQLAGWNPFATASSSPTVRAMARAGSTLYVLGGFSTVAGLPRAGMVALDTRTGLPTDWHPGYGGGLATAIAADERAVYVGGTTTPLPIRAGTRELSAFDATSGALLATTPGAAGDVSQLAIAAGRLFVSGGCGAGRGDCNDLAAIDLRTGRMLDWRPAPVDSLVLSLACTRGTLYAGGWFHKVAGVTQNGLAAFDRTTGALRPWSPLAGSTDPVVVQVAVTDTLAAFVSIPAGGALGNLSGASTRDGSGRLWTRPLNPAAPRPFTAGGLVARNGQVDVGGTFVNVGGVARAYLARLDGATGALAAWNPAPNDAVTAMGPADSVLLVSGAFTRIGGTSVSGGSAVLDDATGRPIAWQAPSGIASPFAVAMDDANVYQGGSAALLDAFAGYTSSVVLSRSTGANRPWDADTYGYDESTRNVRTITPGSGGAVLGGDFVYARDLRLSALTRILPADAGPPLAAIETPAGRYAAIGTVLPITWTATDDERVLSCDVELSRSGAAGPWTLLAGAIPGARSHYEWTVNGSPAADCRLRLTARDLAGNVTRATCASPFAIGDVATPAEVAFFRAEATPAGVRLTWRLADPQAVVVRVERAAGLPEAWSPIDAPSERSGDDRVVLDASVTAGRWWYRLALEAGGTASTTSPIAVDVDGTPARFALGAPAPSPLTTGGTVTFDVPERTKVRIDILDVQGRDVVRVVEGIQEPGRHRVALQAGRLPAGLYFVRMESPGGTFHRRLVRLR